MTLAARLGLLKVKVKVTAVSLTLILCRGQYLCQSTTVSLLYSFVVVTLC